MINCDDDNDGDDNGDDGGVDNGKYGDCGGDDHESLSR